MSLRMLKTIQRYSRSEAGSVLPIAALLFPLILGMAGVSVDISNWMATRHHMQAAADAAALAGAWEMANGGTSSSADAAALKEAENNGYDSASTGTLTTTVTTASGVSTVKSDITQEVNVWFASMFIDTSVLVATTASAQTQTGGSYCILGLDQTEIGAVEASGSVTVDMPNCGIAVNSNSSSALYLNGNVTMNVGSVRTVGDYGENGSVDFTYSSLRTNSSATPDPYEDLAIDAFAGCTWAQQRSGPATYNHDTTLNPGVYCGGIRVTGNNTITLNPGTYIMDGGDFNISGGGSISGTGVTIILTNSGGSSYGSYGNISMSGNKTMYLSAPTTGSYAGIVFYQDRNASETGTNTITGNVGVEIQGSVYLPQRELTFGGNGRVMPSGTDLCTQLVARKVLFHGNPALDSDCDGTGVSSIGTPSAKLVL